jgi:hypothetical protein
MTRNLLPPAKRSSAVLALVLLLAFTNPPAHADGMCTPRAPTAAETKSYADAYALFLRVAPKAPDGWTSTENPSTGEIPGLCHESGNQPIRRHFDRSFHLERGRQERNDQAVQAYAEMMKSQQARAAASQAASDVIDVKMNAIIVKVQEAATAQRFGEVEMLNQQMDALMKQKAALIGVDVAGARSDRIAADQSRDTEASFSLWFEAPSSDARTGKVFPAAAGKAHLTAYDDHGYTEHDLRIFFDGGPQQARVKIEGDPARVRELLEATDLKAIAAFR